MNYMTEHNERMLSHLKHEVKKVCSDIKYEFSEGPNLHRFKTEMIDTINRHYPDGIITREINKTEMPDDVIVAILQNQGCDVKSIDDLTEVTQEWSYNENMSSIYLHTNPVFRLKHTRVEIEINYRPEVKS